MPQPRRPLIPLLALGLLIGLGGCESKAFDFANPFAIFDAEEKDAETGPWTKEGASAATEQADLRECHRVAQARVDRDRQIDSDIAATEGAAGQTTNTSKVLLEDMQRFGYDTRQRRVFERCMRGKGYTRE